MWVKWGWNWGKRTTGKAEAAEVEFPERKLWARPTAISGSPRPGLGLGYWGGGTEGSGPLRTRFFCPSHKFCSLADLMLSYRPFIEQWLSAVKPLYVKNCSSFCGIYKLPPKTWPCLLKTITIAGIYWWLTCTIYIRLLCALGFPGSSAGKDSACNTRDPGSIPGLERSPGKGIGYPLQYSCTSLVAQMVKNLPAKQETWVLSLGWEDSLEEEMTTNSSILAWRISWTEEPGGLLSMGSRRVGHDWATNTFTFHFKYIQQAKSSSHENHHLGTGIYLHYNTTRFSRLVYILIPHSR